MSQSQSTFTRENLNFQLPARQRSCYYEDIALESPTRTVEVFSHSSADLEILLAIYGPLNYKDVIHVSLGNRGLRHVHLFFSSSQTAYYLHRRSNLKMLSRRKLLRRRRKKTVKHRHLLWILQHKTLAHTPFASTTVQRTSSLSTWKFPSIVSYPSESWNLVSMCRSSPSRRN